MEVNCDSRWRGWLDRVAEKGVLGWWWAATVYVVWDEAWEDALYAEMWGGGGVEWREREGGRGRKGLGDGTAVGLAGIYL